MKMAHVIKRLAVILAIILVPPALVFAWQLLDGVGAVMKTRQCPPAPPDVPAYPCSVFSYLQQRALGGWAVAGLLLMLVEWMVLLVLVTLIYQIYRLARKRLALRASSGAIPGQGRGGAYLLGYEHQESTPAPQPPPPRDHR